MRCQKVGIVRIIVTRMTIGMDTNIQTLRASDPRVRETGTDDENRSIAVPAKPSAAMLADGAREGGVTVSVAYRVYQAMIRKIPN